MSGGQPGGGREPADILQNLNDSIKMAEQMVKSGMMKRNDADKHIKVAQAKYKSEMKACKAELKPSARSKAQQLVAPSSFQVLTQQRMQRRRHQGAA